MEPVEVLNTLGGFGYRVVDSTISNSGKMIWTLEHKKFDIESGSGSLRGRDLWEDNLYLIKSSTLYFVYFSIAYSNLASL